MTERRAGALAILGALQRGGPAARGHRRDVAVGVGAHDRDGDGARARAPATCATSARSTTAAAPARRWSRRRRWPSSTASPTSSSCGARATAARAGGRGRARCWPRGRTSSSGRTAWCARSTAWRCSPAGGCTATAGRARTSAAVALRQRAFAQANPAALMRKPMTMRRLPGRADGRRAAVPVRLLPGDRRGAGAGADHRRARGRRWTLRTRRSHVTGYAVGHRHRHLRDDLVLRRGLRRRRRRGTSPRSCGSAPA